MSNFIPSFHFDKTSSKLTPEWCMKAVKYLWYNTSYKGLLDKKKIDEIEKYSTGKFDMKPFRRLFGSIKKSYVSNNKDLISRNMTDDQIDENMQFEPLPLIPPKLNPAISVIQKIPVEVTVTALDPLAAKKKEEDVKFLKNKPRLEGELQDLADQLMMDKVDLGSTKHSSTPYDSSPYGIDLTDPEEEQIFVDLIYSLGVETSFETVLQIFYELKKASQVKLLNITDHFKFGVACFDAYRSRVTGLQEIEYVHPSEMITPDSNLPDFSDNQFRARKIRVTAMELLNRFPSEIKDEDHLNEIINGKSTGYAAKNGSNFVNKSNFDTYKVNLVKFEVRSVDAIGVVQKTTGRKAAYFVDANDERATHRLWGQNTYVFYWLENTDYVFDIHVLDYAHRSKGQESVQNFSTVIYKSQERSAVELSIKENKRAQIADIKMQYALLMSLPAGKYIDIKFLRGAIETLSGEDEDPKYTIDYLIELALERNTMIGDSENFDNVTGGQYQPFIPISGGLGTELNGYFETIKQSKNNISEFTGINDQLTGQSANPDGLIGLQKLLINSSINALYYCNEAINVQQSSLFQIWGEMIKDAIEHDPKAKQAIISMIGKRKVNIIDRLDEIPMHNLGIKITTNQREEERAKFEQRIGRLKQMNVLSVADEYMLDAIQNPKDKIALLAIKEKQFLKRQEKQAQERANQQQQLIQSQGQNMQAVEAAKGENDIKKIYAKGETTARIVELTQQLGLQAKEFDGVIKKLLQSDRNQHQLEKGLAMIEAKDNTQQQQPIS